MKKYISRAKKQISIGITIFFPFTHARWVYFIESCNYAHFGSLIYCQCYTHVFYKSLSILRRVF